MEFDVGVFKRVFEGFAEIDNLWIDGANFGVEWMHGATLEFSSAICVWIRFIDDTGDFNSGFDSLVESFGAPVAVRSAIVFTVVPAHGHKALGWLPKGDWSTAACTRPVPHRAGSTAACARPEPLARRKRVRRGRSLPLGVGAGCRKSLVVHVLAVGTVSFVPSQVAPCCGFGQAK